jgi:hypothetical protein
MTVVVCCGKQLYIIDERRGEGASNLSRLLGASDRSLKLETTNGIGLNMLDWRVWVGSIPTGSSATTVFLEGAV